MRGVGVYGHIGLRPKSTDTQIQVALLAPPSPHLSIPVLGRFLYCHDTVDGGGGGVYIDTLG